MIVVFTTLRALNAASRSSRAEAVEPGGQGDVGRGRSAAPGAASVAGSPQPERAAAARAASGARRARRSAQGGSASHPGSVAHDRLHAASPGVLNRSRVSSAAEDAHGFAARRRTQAMSTPRTRSASVTNAVLAGTRPRARATDGSANPWSRGAEARPGGAPLTRDPAQRPHVEVARVDGRDARRDRRARPAGRLRSEHQICPRCAARRSGRASARSRGSPLPRRRRRHRNPPAARREPPTRAAPHRSPRRQRARDGRRSSGRARSPRTPTNAATGPPRPGATAPRPPL